MTKNDLTKRAFLHATGVVAYIVLFAWCVNNFSRIFGEHDGGWLNMVLALTLFIISASVTASLVLLKPIMLYHEGKKKEAMRMFLYTLGFLALLAIIIGFVIGSS